MATAFDRASAKAEGVILGKLGEAVAFLGQSGGDFTVAADPMRPRLDTVAVVALSSRSGAVADGIQGRGSTGSERAHGFNELWMQRSVFDALDWAPRKNDIVLVAPDQPSERRFQIAAVYPLERSDVQIVINEVGA